MGDSVRKYKSLESEAKARAEFYDEQAESYAEEAAQYTPPYRRKFNGIDDYHRRAENTAFRTGDNFHEASKARREHNTNYMSHFRSRWDMYRHEAAELTDEVKSEGWHATDNAHRDLRAVSSNPPPSFGFADFLTFAQTARPSSSAIEVRAGNAGHARRGIS